jgi:hypothetical protein
VVGDLLEGLAAEELMRGDEKRDVGGGWLRRLQAWRIKKSAAMDWWAKAQKVGEETYLLDRVLPAKGKNDGERRAANEHLLRVIAAKYPKHVPELYRTVLDKRPELDSSDLARTVVRCTLPVKEKIDLLESAVKHKDYAHRLSALRALKDVDRKRFDALLLATIEGLPTDVPGRYHTCSEAQVAELVADSDDPRAWSALEKAAKRAKPGLRMKLLSHFEDPRPLRRAERLRLLGAFLDDDEVRDAVALELATVLEIEVGSDRFLTPLEWATIRAALKVELDKTK